MVLKMVKGTVKWFDSRKGFGFIVSDEGTDIFVHYSAIQSDKDEFRTIYEGDEVEFEVTQGQKGPQASDVKVTKQAPRQFRRNNRRSSF
jgi:CspA family cold shock protein